MNEFLVIATALISIPLKEKPLQSSPLLVSGGNSQLAGQQTCMFGQSAHVQL